LRPFVWRRSLDFTAIEEIRRLTSRIRRAYRGRRDPGPGFDIKRGRGGIREVEFFAQTHQLIYGGRLPALRQRGTRATLDALDGVARLDGLPDGAALVAELRELCSRVAERYDRLLGEGERTPAPVQAEVDPALRERLTDRAAQWRETLRTLRSVEARAALDTVLPDLIEALAAAPDPDHALARWETLLSRLPSAVNLFRLFERRRGLLAQVLRVLTLAGPLADELARRPELLDRLIDSSALDLPGSVESLAARMRRGEAGDDYEQRLDRIRQVVGEERFALGVQLVEAQHDPLAIAAGLSRVAEAALEVAAEAACEEFERV